jgi:LacI family transcriptional regulator
MATIRDVAKLARVSPITVSRVINDIGPVNGQTRVRVLEAIDTLNYVPNQQARSLRSRRTHTLALLITDMTNPFWTTVARGVEDKAAENNFSVILCNTDEDATKEQRYVKVVLEKRVDGVIAAPTSSESTHFRQLGEQRIPLVLLDRRVRGLEIDIVLCENIGTSRDLVSSLIGQGHRRIAVISGPEQISTGPTERRPSNRPGPDPTGPVYASHGTGPHPRTAGALGPPDRDLRLQQLYRLWHIDHAE